MRFKQVQTMEFADGIVRGEGEDRIGSFRIEGQYRLEGDLIRIGWIKTYEGAHSVLYLGAYDGTEILGDWEVQGGIGSRFGFAPAPVAPKEYLEDINNSEPPSDEKKRAPPRGGGRRFAPAQAEPHTASPYGAPSACRTKRQLP
jgi:hypothetical protein